MSETEDGDIRGSFRYNTDLFERATIERMSIHFNHLLSTLTSAPDQMISTLPMITVGEKYLLVNIWNGSEAQFPSDKAIHKLFEVQVEKTPDVVAVRVDGDELTYAELNRRANLLAHHLVESGVVRNTVVGLCVERSANMIVGLIGILKAGGAYLPLDPSYPLERLSFMLEDSQTSYLVTQSELLGSLPEYQGNVISLDQDWQVISKGQDINPEIEVTGEDLVYLIYTSGTTGVPKGVQVMHRNLVNHAWEMMRQFDVRVGERILEYISISFDAALEGIFPVLFSGGTIVVAKNPAELVGTSLLEIVKNEQINYLHLPVSVWHQTVAEMERLDLKAPACIKFVLVGGEQVDLDRLTAWSKRLDSKARFLNAYGPTETTITATVFETESGPGVEIPNEQIPIGTPIANMRAYVLDDVQNLLPVGLPGELYIGGEGVTAGYLNRPELNKAAFLPDPFDDDPEFSDVPDRRSGEVPAGWKSVIPWTGR